MTAMMNRAVRDTKSSGNRRPVFVVAIVVALTGSRPKKNHPGRPLPK